MYRQFPPTLESNEYQIHHFYEGITAFPDILGLLGWLSCLIAYRQQEGEA